MARAQAAGALLQRSAPPAMLFALAFGLYAATAAPDLTWAHHGADGGDLIAAAVSGGIPHPSGYPTYCLLGRLAAALPIGTVAWRFHLLSAAAAAGAVVLVYLCALRVLRSTVGSCSWAGLVAALLVALAWATSPALWSQATIAEVHTLQALFTALILCLAMYEELLHHGWTWFVLGLIVGLGLGVHLTLLLSLPALALLLAPGASARRLSLLLLGLGIGLSTYLYLPVAARGGSPVKWGDASTWQGFWWLVTGRIYRHYILAVPLQHLPLRLAAWARLCSQQYAGVGVVLGLLGLLNWASHRPRLALATGISFAAHTIYALTYDTADSHVYLIPAFLVATLWLAEGASQSLGRPPRSRVRSALVVAVLLAIPAWSFAANVGSLDLRHDRQATAWLEGTLGELPSGAVLLTTSDQHTFAAAYGQWAQGRRPDVLVVDSGLWAEPWYRAQIAQRMATPEATEWDTGELVTRLLATRPVFIDSPGRDLAPAYGVVARGGLWEITAGCDPGDG